MNYDEPGFLITYVTEHCAHVMTDAERNALSHFRALKKAAHSTGRISNMIRDRWGEIRSEEARSLVELGEAAFLERLRDRVVADHPSVVNRCPMCDKVTRTPKAKQCPWCFHDWHAA